MPARAGSGVTSGGATATPPPASTSASVAIAAEVQRFVKDFREQAQSAAGQLQALAAAPSRAASALRLFLEPAATGGSKPKDLATEWNQRALEIYRFMERERQLDVRPWGGREGARLEEMGPEDQHDQLHLVAQGLLKKAEQAVLGVMGDYDLGKPFFTKDKVQYARKAQDPNGQAVEEMTPFIDSREWFWREEERELAFQALNKPRHLNALIQMLIQRGVAFNELNPSQTTRDFYLAQKLIEDKSIEMPFKLVHYSKLIAAAVALKYYDLVYSFSLTREALIARAPSSLHDLFTQLKGTDDALKQIPSDWLRRREDDPASIHPEVFFWFERTAILIQIFRTQADRLQEQLQKLSEAYRNSDLEARLSKNPDAKLRFTDKHGDVDRYLEIYALLCARKSAPHFPVSGNGPQSEERIISILGDAYAAVNQLWPFFEMLADAYSKNQTLSQEVAGEAAQDNRVLRRVAFLSNNPLPSPDIVGVSERWKFLLNLDWPEPDDNKVRKQKNLDGDTMVDIAQKPSIPVPVKSYEPSRLLQATRKNLSDEFHQILSAAISDEKRLELLAEVAHKAQDPDFDLPDLALEALWEKERIANAGQTEDIEHARWEMDRFLKDADPQAFKMKPDAAFRIQLSYARGMADIRWIEKNGDTADQLNLLSALIRLKKAYRASVASYACMVTPDRLSSMTFALFEGAYRKIAEEYPGTLKSDAPPPPADSEMLASMAATPVIGTPAFARTEIDQPAFRESPASEDDSAVKMSLSWEAVPSNVLYVRAAKHSENALLRPTPRLRRNLNHIRHQRIVKAMHARRAAGQRLAALRFASRIPMARLASSNAALFLARRGIR